MFTMPSLNYYKKNKGVINLQRPSDDVDIGINQKYTLKGGKMGCLCGSVG